MNSKKPVAFESLATSATENLAQLDAINESDWGFGTETSWQYSQETGTLMLQFDEKKTVNLDCDILGTWNATEASWLWAWGNNAINQQLRLSSEQTRKFGEENNIDYLSQRKWECDESFCVELAAIAVFICQLKGLCRPIVGDVTVFLGVKGYTMSDQFSKPGVDEEEECRRAVLHFVNQLNHWEVIAYILSRVRENMHVSQNRLKLVEDLTNDQHYETHRKLFQDYVVPRSRKYGSNPGTPNGISRDGRFTNVNDNSIDEIQVKKGGSAFVVANWGFMGDGGWVKFKLFKKNGRWLVDRLYVRAAEDDPWSESDF